MNTIIDINYDNGFISNLLKDVDDKIAYLSNKDYKSQIYNLGVSNSLSGYSNLLVYRNILDKILKCNTCFSSCLEEFKIEDIVSQVKLELNKC